jgi:glycosyltransferase involved in cell wall biosynthesis
VSGQKEGTVLPRVSVIMPFYNLERFIPESIESVLAQTYPHWELLLIDDGSTDGSTGIAQDYARAHPDRIRYLSHESRENRGASASRNLGIRRARGEYIALLDADDVWVTNKLEEQVPLLDAHPEVGSLYGRTLYWYSWTGRRQDRNRDFVDHRIFPDGTILNPPALLVAILRGKTAVPGTCSLLARRSVVEQVGGFEESFIRVYTDQVFYAKLFLAAPVLIAGQCWDRYRQHEDSSCSRAEREGRLHARRLEYLQWFRRYLEQEGWVHAELELAVDRAMWPYRHPRLNRVVRGYQRLAEGATALFWHRVVPLAFAVARTVLPRSVRERLWARWQRSAGPDGRAPPGR